MFQAMMDQTSKLKINDKKTNFGPDFSQFDHNLGHQIFFVGITSTCNKISFQPIIQSNLKEKQ